MTALPATMKALILNEGGFSAAPDGKPLSSLEPYLTYGDLPVPTPGPGQVLVKVRMASVNPSDVYFVKGEYGQKRVKGAAAGFEGVGDVVATGSGLFTSYLKGKRVAFVGGIQGSGAWAEYNLLRAAVCTPVKPSMRDEDAAGHIVNPVTAITMFDLVRKSGSKSFIFTAAFSQLGKLMAGLARDHGHAMIAIIRKESQAAHLRELGAAHVLVQTDPDFQTKLAAVIRDEKPRILLDALGNQFAADLLMAMPPRARWIIYGKLDTEAKPSISETGQFIFMDKTIEGYWLTKWFSEASTLKIWKTIAAVQRRFISGKWKTEVTQTIRLADAMEKLPDALSESGGKVMIVP